MYIQFLINVKYLIIKILYGDDAKKLSLSCAALTCFKQNLRDGNKENPTESISVVPAKYPPKVNSERISTTLECQSWKKFRIPWLVRDLAFL